jgi:hypothetical protein
MFLPTLQAAHTAWLRHTALGSTWSQIGEGIEFSEHLAREPEGSKISRLALRSLGRKYDQAVVVVESIKGDADRGVVVFDETRIVSGVDKNPRVIALPSIPPYLTDLTETGITDSTFRVRITSLTEDGITRAVNLRSSEFSPLDQILAQPHLWKWINSELFHIGEIVWAKEEIRERHRIWPTPIVAFVFWMPPVLRLRKFEPRVFEEHSQLRKAARRNTDEENTP